MSAEKVEPEPAKVDETSVNGAAPPLDESVFTPPDELEEKIIKQIEYYFGDINLPRDRFLQEELKKDDRWIPLEVMLRFNRLKQLTTDAEVIGSALKKSSDQLMEVSQDGTKIRRRSELPKNTFEYWQAIKKRTVYAKGFPRDTTTLDKLQEFFAKFGNVKNIIMHRVKMGDQKVFKGSVFITYETRAECDKLLGDEGSSKFEENEIALEFQEDYTKRKQLSRKQDRLKKKEEKEADKRKEFAKKSKPYTKGMILQVKGIGADEKISDIKRALEKYGDLKWVDKVESKEETYLLRFVGDEGAATTAWEKIQEAMTDQIFKFKTEGEEGVEKEWKLEGSILEGEAEAQHWEKIFAESGKKDMRGKRKGPGGKDKWKNKKQKVEKRKKIVFKDDDDEGEEKSKEKPAEEKTESKETDSKSQ